MSSLKLREKLILARTVIDGLLSDNEQLKDINEKLTIKHQDELAKIASEHAEQIKKLSAAHQIHSAKAKAHLLKLLNYVLPRKVKN